MPIRFTPPGALGSGVSVSPQTQAAADLGAHMTTNYHLAGTSLQPNASQQQPPMRGAIDPADPDAMRLDQLSGAYLTPGVPGGATLTQAADTPPQALARAETLEASHSLPFGNDVLRAIGLQQQVMPAAVAQHRADLGRAQEAAVNNAAYQRLAVPSQAANDFLNGGLMASLGPREMAVMEGLARRMAGAPSVMPISV